jgi:hypothetical protein
MAGLAAAGRNEAAAMLSAMNRLSTQPNASFTGVFHRFMETVKDSSLLI